MIEGYHTQRKPWVGQGARPRRPGRPHCSRRNDPSIVRRQAEGGHPFEDLDVQIDPARCHQVAVKLGHLPCMRCEARSNGGDADAIDREIVVAIEAGCRITNPRGGEHQIVGGDMIEVDPVCETAGAAS